MSLNKEHAHHPLRYAALVLLAFVLIAVAVGIPLRQRMVATREVVSLIRHHGGSVVFSPGKPAWFRQYLSADYRLMLDSLREVHLANSTIDDASLQKLGGLSNVTMLSLNNTKITNTGLAHIQDWQNLEVLWLSGTEIGDEGIVHLYDLNNLKLLYLDDTNVSETGVAKLREATFTDVQW